MSKNQTQVASFLIWDTLQIIISPILGTIYQQFQGNTRSVQSIMPFQRLALSSCIYAFSRSYFSPIWRCFVHQFINFFTYSSNKLHHSCYLNIIYFFWILSCLFIIKLYFSLVRSERDEYVRLLHMPGEWIKVEVIFWQLILNWITFGEEQTRLFWQYSLSGSHLRR